MTPKENSINYIEFPMHKTQETIDFYSKIFGWTFTKWGPHYVSFSDAEIEGGFNGEGDMKSKSPGVLIVLYSQNLVEKAEAISQAGCKVIKPIYAFPGGKRFHFLDPNGNELAVWSEN